MFSFDYLSYAKSYYTLSLSSGLLCQTAPQKIITMSTTLLLCGKQQNQNQRDHHYPSGDKLSGNLLGCSCTHSSSFADNTIQVDQISFVHMYIKILEKRCKVENETRKAFYMEGWRQTQRLSNIQVRT